MKNSFILTFLVIGFFSTTVCYAAAAPATPNPTEPTSPTTPEEKVPKCPAGYAQMCEVNCTAKAETNAECEDKLKKCLEDEAQYCKDNGAEIYPSFEDVPPSANRLSTSITPETELVKCSAPTRLCCAKKP
jgi:hypothetical protein